MHTGDTTFRGCAGPAGKGLQAEGILPFGQAGTEDIRRSSIRLISWRRFSETGKPLLLGLYYPKTELAKNQYVKLGDTGRLEQHD